MTGLIDQRRYFYTDALAAAWMAKHFGMRFEDRKKLVNEIFYLGDSGYLADHLDNSTKFYIHPESLPLLEPQPGDLIFVAGYDGDPDIAVEHGDPHLDPANDRHIVLRDGKPFHWPKEEVL